MARYSSVSVPLGTVMPSGQSAAEAQSTTTRHPVQAPPRRTFVVKAWSAVLVSWGALTGLAPHLLHHVGPLAGTALVAGAGGQALFAGIALAVSIPFLLRIYRRFHTWIAPLIALAVMTAMFALSTFVIGPAIRGEDNPTPQPGIEQPVPDPHGH